MTTAGKCN